MADDILNWRDSSLRPAKGVLCLVHHEGLGGQPLSDTSRWNGRYFVRSGTRQKLCPDTLLKRWIPVSELHENLPTIGCAQA